MEQKQLDEEDTFFGEEFIEEDTSKEEIKVESISEEKARKESKKTSTKKAAKVEEPKVEIIPNKEVIKEAPKKEVKEAPKVTEKVESVAPIDPWDDDEDDEGGFFKNTSGWKLIAGILLVLLVASIYTNGFGMAGNVNGQELSLSEAESKALSYVNENLLQPPFVAELESSEDVGNLYKVTLSVAGQTVDSYLTKDGNLFFPQGFETDGSLTETGSADLVEVSLDDDAVKGDANAPVTIVEFSDYECPFCGKYVQETYPSIVSEYINTGKVKYVFRDFPLDFHLNAQKAAEAAECAGDQDQYWEMHDYLFANQDYLAVDNLKGYAKDLGLDLAEFNDCLDSGKFADEVAADLLDGQAYGVSGTPAFFINGKLVSGALPFAAFKEEIDAALANVGKTVEVQIDEVAEEIDLVEEETSDLVLPVEEVVEEPVVEDVVEVKMVPLTAKKWMFGPNKIVVGKNDVVQLNIIPQGLQFTLAIPGFGVEQEVTGATMVEFTANKVGTFEFKCSSCEDWRGMTGTLVVE